MCKISFAVGEISGLVVFGKGNVVGFANILGLESGDRIFLGEFFEGGVFCPFGVEGFELFAESIGFETKRASFAIAGEENEKKWADNWETDDDEGPEQAHFEVLIIIDDVEGDGEGEEDGEDSDGEEVAVEEEVENYENDELSENAEDSPSEAVGEKAFEDAEGVVLGFMWYRG